MRGFFTVILLFILSESLIANSYEYEVEPYFGRNFSDNDSDLGDSNLIGFKFNNYLDENVALQFAYEYLFDAKYKESGLNHKESDKNRFFFNGLYQESLDYGLTPYVFGGLGYEDVSKKCLCECSQWLIDLGAGLKYRLYDNIDLHSEAKIIRKLGNSNVDFVGSFGLGYLFNVNNYKPPQKFVVPQANIEPIQEEIIREPSVLAPTQEKQKTIKVEDDCPHAYTPANKDSCDGPFYVQVASIIKCLPTDYFNNKKFLNKIKKAGYNYTIYNTTSGGKKVSKVLIGPYKCLSQAKKNICKIRKKLKSDAFVYKKR